MAKKGAAGGDGGGSKKAQGQARKADAAASKQAAKDKQVEAAETEKWDKGAKSNAKAYGNQHINLLQPNADRSIVRPPPKRPPKPPARKPRKKPSCAKRRRRCPLNPRAKHRRLRRKPRASTPPSEISTPSPVH
jgi:hypothetical protein